MASLPPEGATEDDVLEELDFNEVLIASLDDGADDHVEKLAELENVRHELEKRLEAVQQRSRETGSGQSTEKSAQQDMDGTNEHGGWWQQDGDSQGSGTAFSYAWPRDSPVNGTKRPFPQSAHLDSVHPAKRRTPEPYPAFGNAGSSTRPYARPEMSNTERARQRQMAAEAASQRQREDQELARRLSQQSQAFPSTFNQRPGVQTTLNGLGSFNKPLPQPKVEPAAWNTPHNPSSRVTPTYANNSVSHIKNEHQSIKPDPNPVKQQDIAWRPRQTQTVDLTADSDDEDVTEVAQTMFTPNGRARRTGAPPRQPAAPAVQAPYLTQRPMPGTYPDPNAYPCQNVYNSDFGQDWLQHANALMSNRVSDLRNIGRGLQDSFAELGNLINPPMEGSSRGHDMTGLNDFNEDLVYGGSRQLDPFNPLYAGYGNLYADRYNQIADNDPAKTREEINALLENIRPDEDMVRQNSRRSSQTPADFPPFVIACSSTHPNSRSYEYPAPQVSGVGSLLVAGHGRREQQRWNSCRRDGPRKDHSDAFAHCYAQVRRSSVQDNAYHRAGGSHAPVEARD